MKLLMIEHTPISTLGYRNAVAWMVLYIVGIHPTQSILKRHDTDFASRDPPIRLGNLDKKETTFFYINHQCNVNDSVPISSLKQ